MPKNKTHSGASKRFQVTGSGKIRRQKAGLRHNLEHKAVQGDPPHERHHRGRQGRHREGQEAPRPLSPTPAPIAADRSPTASRSNKWHASSGQSTPTRSAG